MLVDPEQIESIGEVLCAFALPIEKAASTKTSKTFTVVIFFG
ncbi:MAG: hypothetical protein ACEQSR_03555 [Candidatus Methylacidiphilales bacterium]